MCTRNARGNAAIEFALISPFLFALLCGILVYGTMMVKELQIIQVARDLASMYARGVDFSLAANQALVTRLGEELGLQASGGNGVVILSTLEFITQTQCNAYPGPGTCNKGNWVFMNRISFGDTTKRTSNYGAPSGTCVTNMDSRGNLATSDSVTQSCALVSNFTALGTPAVGTNGFQPGQPAYLVEVYAQTGAPGEGAYAFSLF